MLRTLALQTGVFATFLALCGSAAAQPAQAEKSRPAEPQKPPGKKGVSTKAAKKKAPTLDLAALSKVLESGDETATLDGLQRISEAAEAEAAPLVDALLIRGANTKVLVRAIEVSQKLAQPASAAPLAPYVSHRKAEVRRAAARALAHTKASEATAALRRALRSSDAEVRSAAARGLGTLGAKDAVEDLFAVLPKETPDAAGPIGTLCSGPECERFVDLMGKLPFDVIESGLEPLLLRASADVSDDLKIKVVERLRRLATKAATELLERMKMVWPADASPTVKRAIDAALKGRAAGAGGK